VHTKDLLEGSKLALGRLFQLLVFALRRQGIQDAGLDVRVNWRRILHWREFVLVGTLKCEGHGPERRSRYMG
jgi:hypothetical protein